MKSQFLRRLSALTSLMRIVTLVVVIGIALIAVRVVNLNHIRQLKAVAASHATKQAAQPPVTPSSTAATTVTPAPAASMPAPDTSSTVSPSAPAVNPCTSLVQKDTLALIGYEAEINSQAESETTQIPVNSSTDYNAAANSIITTENTQLQTAYQQYLSFLAIDSCTPSVPPPATIPLNPGN